MAPPESAADHHLESLFPPSQLSSLLIFSFRLSRWRVPVSCVLLISLSESPMFTKPARIRRPQAQSGFKTTRVVSAFVCVSVCIIARLGSKDVDVGFC